MTESLSLHDRDRLLQRITSLSLDEIDGWRGMLRLMADRPFPGEAEALTRRERQLTKAA